MTRQASRRAGAVLIALMMAACGVPAGDDVRTIDADRVPYGLLRTEPPGPASRPAAGPAVTVPRVYFVNGQDELVAQPEPLDASGSEAVVDVLLDRLAAGPTETQRSSGLGTALNPDVGLRLQEIADAVARIQLSLSAPEPSADRLPLIIGQVVLTATSAQGVDRVLFVQEDGAPAEVPLPGGARTSQPVSAVDYASLVAGGP